MAFENLEYIASHPQYKKKIVYRFFTHSNSFIYNQIIQTNPFEMILCQRVLKMQVRPSVQLRILPKLWRAHTTLASDLIAFT